jgi:NADH dehydrogenase
MTSNERSEPRSAHRVLILGGGFAGVETAHHLERLTHDRDDVEVWLVNRENFMLFTPLLPEVCSGMLEARHCVTALRAQLRRPSSWAITATVEGIDLEARVVTVLGGDGDLHGLHYDTLVLALGGETATFGIKGITEYAIGMKTLADAFALRNRIIEMLERADLEEDPAERRAQLTFVVGGGGFSGVETAGEIEDFVGRLRRRYYPKIGEDEPRFFLIELKDRLLPEGPAAVGRYAARQLRKRGYELRLKTALTEVQPGGIVVGEGEFIATRTIVWTGGVRPASMVRDSGVEVDRAGRAVARATMETSREGVFAIGDCASIPNPDDPAGRFAPTAQNAVREAKRLAQNILARIDGRPMEPFRYETIGMLASLGHNTGVGVVRGVRVHGFPAWLMWRGYYWSRVPGFNRKVRVGIDWALGIVFGSDPVQLKVEYEGQAVSPSGVRRPPRRVVDPRG